MAKVTTKHGRVSFGDWTAQASKPSPGEYIVLDIDAGERVPKLATLAAGSFSRAATHWAPLPTLPQ